MEENNVMNQVEEMDEQQIEVAQEPIVPAAPQAPIYVLPAEPDKEQGPNKALIALGIGAGLILANKARKKIKAKIQERKERKQADELKKFSEMLDEVERLKAQKAQAQAALEAASAKPEVAEVETETPAAEEAEE